MLLASFAPAQYLEATIMLPDTLGPLNGPYHLACTDDSAFPRLYIGGEGDSGGVIVAEALTCERLARIPTGPVKALCYVASHNKLYVAKAGTDSIEVVDCGTNQVVATVQVAGEVPVMQYNRRNDRLYCGGASMSVVDCAADTLVRTIPVPATVFALDSIRNKLYAGDTLYGGALAVVDCAGDSVVATIACPHSVGALCFNPTAKKVYAASGDTLYAVQTASDSIVARLPFSGLSPLLTCDPERNRVYCVYSARWASVDCGCDSVILTVNVGLTPSFIACNVARDILYLTWSQYSCKVEMEDATTGQFVAKVWLDGITSGIGWCPALERLYCLPSLMESPPAQSCLLTVVDGAADSITVIVPVTMFAGSICVDSLDNKLYFLYPSIAGCIGVVDCSRNIVTSYTYAGVYPLAICYNGNNNRLYCGKQAGNGDPYVLTVFDCATDTVVKRIVTDGNAYVLRLHPTLNKLYVSDNYYPTVIDVIDCDTDSITARIRLPGEDLTATLLVPEDNRLWYLGSAHVVVVDCLGDSVVADVIDNLGSVDDACACPEDRKIYAGWGGRPAWIVDMDNPAHIDTLHSIISDAGMRFLNMPGAHKAYWCVNYPSGNGRIFVIDTRTSALIDSFWIGFQLSGMCLDRTGRYVYGTGYDEPSGQTILAIDTRGDSVVVMVTLPSFCYGPLQANSTTARLYPSSCGNPIPVVRDSVLIGIEEDIEPQPSGSKPEATVACGVLHVPASGVIRGAVCGLHDITGRKALDLHPGANDVRALSPGVYFVRQRSAVGGERSSVTKVVIAK